MTKTEKTYLEIRLEELKIDDKTNTIRVLSIDYPPQDCKYFEADKNGDIRINYFTPTGAYAEYDHKGKLEKFYRTRHANSENNPKKNKYSQPFESGISPFITPVIIEKVKTQKEIETLFMVEGEFKAFAGYLAGLDIIGVGGINSIRDKKENDLDEYIKKIIEVCKVKNLIFIFDADLFKIKYEDNKDLWLRPNSFYSAVHYFKEVCKPLNIDIYLSYVNPELMPEIKGLDDLLIHKDTKVTQVIKELTKFTVGNPKRKYILTEAVSYLSEYKLKEFFRIDSIESFYHTYSEAIGEREFIYRGNTYYYDSIQKKPVVSFYKEARSYIRVGVNFYKKGVMENAHKEHEQMLIEWNIGTINLDHNNNKYFVQQIPKYDLFCNIPDNTNKYERVHKVIYNELNSVLYNRYSPLYHKPAPGSWSTIEKGLKHIFECKNLAGDSLYEFGLDYIQQLYFNPTQKLPVLCLVSRERNTGKSKFLEFLRMIFKENMTILDNERFTGKFTSHFIDKLIISIDEGFIPVEQKLMKERLKNYATGKKQWLEAKGRPAQELDFYGHLILCSNDETNFMQIDQGENRFAVIKVEPLIQDDPLFVEKMEKEINCFIHYLSQRKLHYETNQSRLSFHPSVYMTEAMQNVIERNKNRVELEIEDFIKESFILSKQQVLYFSPVDITDYINKNTQYKIANTTVINFLKYDKRMKASLYTKCYKKYFLTNTEDVLTLNFNFIHGRPYEFKVDEWLTSEEKEGSFIPEKLIKEQEKKETELEQYNIELANKKRTIETMPF